MTEIIHPLWQKQILNQKSEPSSRLFWGEGLGQVPYVAALNHLHVHKE